MPKRPAESSPEQLLASARKGRGPSVHPLFENFEETNHIVTEAATAACDADSDLTPGLNCCAVCAGKPKDGSALVTCTLCQKGKLGQLAWIGMEQDALSIIHICHCRKLIHNISHFPC